MVGEWGFRQCISLIFHGSNQVGVRFKNSTDQKCGGFACLAALLYFILGGGFKYFEKFHHYLGSFDPN